ncbi:hypothetical protein PAXRUDRAFT_823302 [Paxillus rubicundulus Ve08.2h10]|uniref:F-box domain-containing protein n=1 Tax=Paxillus rubicundulus Ve08.2h10 TaxID=930991 RepID=A0A0D0EC91_9AGAM|nr:hypothetical protein PAXRUDRAFT_823302 [Paxillus rubicundulus Ve08.2h10]
MHNALHIQEILSNVFNRVCTDRGGFEWQPNLNPSLAALARTCRAFQEPALDALWFQLDDLTPLLKCLTKDVWTLFATVQTSQCRTEVIGIRRALSESEWGILQSYTRRIRVIASINSPTGQLAETTMQALCYPPMVSPLFPNLYRLKWNDFRPETLPFIRQLAGPKVTNLIIGDLTSLGPAELSILGSLRHLCPHVKEVQILTPKNDTLPTDIVSELLCSWTDLQTVKCRSINGNALLHLTTLETLEVLSFTFDRRSFKHVLGTSIFQFPALRRLFITSPALPSLSKMMLQLRVSIEALFISFGGWPTTQHIHSFVTAMQQSCTQDDMRFIDLRQLDIFDLAVQVPASANPLILGDLFPLACFSNLVSVTLDTGYTVDLRDDDMLALGAAWPSIRLLSINEQRGWRGSSGLTPQGLVRLLQQCKLLRKLCVVIDTIGFSAIPLDRHGPVLSSTCINVLDSVIEPESVAALAAFLSDVYPFLKTITAWDTRVMSKRPDAAGYKKLWNNVQVLTAEMVKVRTQERRWDVEARPDDNESLGSDNPDVEGISDSGSTVTRNRGNSSFRIYLQNVR